jgi:hydroxymethylpyrimidine/phosphomethylpyrimidine kinase
MRAVALTIAGSDPSGGAGIQADLKTFHQFGVYGEAVLTLVTVQSTRAVSRVEVLPADLVRQQIEEAIADIPPRAAKTGALGSAEVVEAIAAIAPSLPFPLVVDPVIVSKHGARLVSEEAQQTLKTKLLPHAALITPNIPEAEALTGTTIGNPRQMVESAKRLLDLGCKSVLVKGGHLSGEPLDVFAENSCVQELSGFGRVQSRHTHGTGCTYSAAITACLALGDPKLAAIFRARVFVQSAIEPAPGLGAGCGPVNHFAPTREVLSISEQ